MRLPRRAERSQGWILEKLRKWFRDDISKNTRGFMVAAFFATGAFWFKFLHQTTRYRESSALVIENTVTFLLVIVVLIWGARVARSTARLIYWVAVAVAAYVAEFSSEYFNHGTAKDFTGAATKGLSHLDAIYFSLGTLSTAGTGSLSARSQAVRAIQTVQMALDIVLVVFVLGLAVSRFAAKRR
jgi:hypothetical protein